LLRIRIFVSLLTILMTAGCKAQTATQTALDPAVLNRRIEVLVRSQFNIPQDYVVTLGAHKPSQVNGYDTLPITFTRGGKSQQADFLISTDGKTLARLDTFDLVKNPVFSIDVAGRPIRGNPNAKVTVINFDDLECPYCARMHVSLFPDTIQHYKDKVRFIYKDAPLTQIHPWAMRASVDANCLAAQSGDTYWTYVDYLHAHGDEISGPDNDPAKSFAALDRVARQQATLAKLDTPKLDICLANQDKSQVESSQLEAETLRIEGTPALFVDGERIDGLVSEEQLWLVIDRALRAAGVEPPTAQAAPALPAKPSLSPGAGK
jgi:protein-disulfide isomerase